jgi:hypothetical protein
MIDWQQYTDLHAHPADTVREEIVGYERKDGRWDVYVCEPVGSCPELEGERADEAHIFVETVESSGELDRVAQDVYRRLGRDYELEVYFRESGGRPTIDRIHSHLQRRGAHLMRVGSAGKDAWELLIRRKDFGIASEIAASNTTLSGA